MKYLPSFGSKLWAVVGCAVASVAVVAANSVAKAAPRSYEKSGEVSGAVISKGSDTMANLMGLWSDAFKKFYPNVTFEIEPKGSALAPKALTEGTANLGPMSRAMEPEGNRPF